MNSNWQEAVCLLTVVNRPPPPFCHLITHGNIVACVSCLSRCWRRWRTIPTIFYASPATTSPFSSLFSATSRLCSPVKIVATDASQPMYSSPCLRLSLMHRLSPIAPPFTAAIVRARRSRCGGSPWPPSSTPPWLDHSCRRTDQFIRIQVQWQSASGRTVILEPI